METQTEPKEYVPHQFDVCPNCGTKIVIAWGRVSVITVSQHREEVQRELKELKKKNKELRERDKHGKQD